MLRIIGVYEWDGWTKESATKSTGLSPLKIAWKEGFRSWGEFIHTYQSLNHGNFGDESRKNYFIEFRMLCEIDDPVSGLYTCTRCEKDFAEKDLNWTFHHSPICDDCLGEDYMDRHYRNNNPRAGYY